MVKTLYEIINDTYFQEFGTYPDLENPQDYNEKVQWLKLYDQMPEHTICVDKLLAKGYVAQKVDTDCLLDVYQVARSVDGIDFDALPSDYVLKTNHDSGSVFIIQNGQGLRAAKRHIRKNLKRIFGYKIGEWAYSHIHPYVFAEEFMSGEVIDYKIHCSLGDVKWVRMVYERDTGTPIEVIVDKNFKPLGLHLNYKFSPSRETRKKPDCWTEMMKMAETLSKPFKYVSVDLYDYNGRPIFGELTLYPHSGLIKTSDALALGQLLDIDTSTKRPPVHSRYNYELVSQPRGEYLWERLIEKARNFISTGRI